MNWASREEIKIAVAASWLGQIETATISQTRHFNFIIQTAEPQ